MYYYLTNSGEIITIEIKNHSDFIKAMKKGKNLSTPNGDLYFFTYKNEKIVVKVMKRARIEAPAHKLFLKIISEWLSSKQNIKEYLKLQHFMCLFKGCFFYKNKWHYIFQWIKPSTDLKDWSFKKGNKKISVEFVQNLLLTLLKVFSFLNKNEFVYADLFFGNTQSSSNFLVKDNGIFIIDIDSAHHFLTPKTKIVNNTHNLWTLFLEAENSNVIIRQNNIEFLNYLMWIEVFLRLAYAYYNNLTFKDYFEIFGVYNFSYKHLAIFIKNLTRSKSHNKAIFQNLPLKIFGDSSYNFENFYNDAESFIKSRKFKKSLKSIGKLYSLCISKYYITKIENTLINSPTSFIKIKFKVVTLSAIFLLFSGFYNGDSNNKKVKIFLNSSPQPAKVVLCDYNAISKPIIKGNNKVVIYQIFKKRFCKYIGKTPITLNIDKIMEFTKLFYLKKDIKEKQIFFMFNPEIKLFQNSIKS